jgi:hypothetical protein
MWRQLHGICSVKRSQFESDGPGVDVLLDYCNNNNMNDAPTVPDVNNDPAFHDANARVVVDHFISDSPLDTEVVHRVCARAERVIADAYRKLGEPHAAAESMRQVRFDLGNGNINRAAILAVVIAMQWEIEQLREERDLYLDAIYAAKRAAQPAEVLPSFEELMRNTSRKIDFNL